MGATAMAIDLLGNSTSNSEDGNLAVYPINPNLTMSFYNSGLGDAFLNVTTEHGHQSLSSESLHQKEYMVKEATEKTRMELLQNRRPAHAEKNNATQSLKRAKQAEERARVEEQRAVRQANENEKQFTGELRKPEEFNAGLQEKASRNDALSSSLDRKKQEYCDKNATFHTTQTACGTILVEYFDKVEVHARKAKSSQDAMAPISSIFQRTPNDKSCYEIKKPHKRFRSSSAAGEEKIGGMSLIRLRSLE
ncbi:hypothetical protein LTR28_008544 [Elasticomyces elasticus]|nr:hypothetical protein LTR28_008544 [Elasticomyces elasticus]